MPMEDAGGNTVEPSGKSMADTEYGDDFEGGDEVEKSAKSAAKSMADTDYGDDTFEEDASAAGRAKPEEAKPATSASSAPESAPAASSDVPVDSATTRPGSDKDQSASPMAKGATSSPGKSTRAQAKPKHASPATKPNSSKKLMVSASPREVVPPPPPRRKVHMAPAPNNSKFTFTAAPSCIAAKRTHFRADYTHTAQQLWQMERGNKALCQRLLEISKAPPAKEFSTVEARVKPGALSSQAAARRRREQEIVRGNLMLFKRLQAVKPSTDISRAKLHKDFEKAQKAGKHLRKVKDVPQQAQQRHPAASVAASPRRREMEPEVLVADAMAAEAEANEAAAEKAAEAAAQPAEEAAAAVPAAPEPSGTAGDDYDEEFEEEGTSPTVAPTAIAAA